MVLLGFAINLICIFLRAAVEEGLGERQNVEGRSMVFFHNINPGARVQVRWRGEIENGTIRYAGSLVAKDGEWVGIELDNRGSVNQASIFVRKRI